MIIIKELNYQKTKRWWKIFKRYKKLKKKINILYKIYNLSKNFYIKEISNIIILSKLILYTTGIKIQKI